MTWTLLFSFFALGAIVGSFLNVVTLRYGASTFRGRSRCLSCGKPLRWFELLPIASFLIQGGRCRGCRSRFSIQYPLVECATGLVFAAIAWKESSLIFSSPSLLTTNYLLLTFFLWSLLVALSIYDFKHKILPDGLMYGALAAACLLFLLRFFVGAVPHPWLDGLGGLFFAAPFALLWRLTRGRAMGLGDAKLVLLFPWAVGFARGLSALIIGFWIGAGLAVLLLLAKTAMRIVPGGMNGALGRRLARLGLKTELPLGPFLVLGLFLVYLFGWDVTGLSLLLQ